MAQLSAYSLLEGFEKRKSITEVLSYRAELFINTIVCEIDPVPGNFNPSAIIKDPFLAQHYHTGNSFIQQTTSDVNTHIANLGVPYAPPFNSESLEKKDIFYDHITKNLDKSFTVYEIEHCTYTVSISYCEKYSAFAISATGQTIICENLKDIEGYSQPMHERPCKVAYQFFQIYNKFTQQKRASFAKDLIYRSLVGQRGINCLEWFAIVEHYADQRMLPFDQVREFIKFYDLEIVKIIETKQVTISDLPAIQSRLYNQTIPQFHDIYRGTTLYFWQDKRYLGNCFVSSKHYEILSKLKKQILNKQRIKDIYDYLRNFKLTELETDFYHKYTDYMYDQFDPVKDKFPSFTQRAFNAIHSKISPEQKQKNLVLSQCIIPTIIVVIPIGIKGMGYEALCTQIQKNCYHMGIIQNVNQINDNRQIYFLNQVCTLNQVFEINQKCKALPYSIKTIALQPECTHEYLIKGKYRFPFSFKFIMFCLLSVLEDQNAVKELILQLKQFEEKQFQNLPTDITIKCRYMPSQREKDDLYSEIVEQDFEAALNSSNDQLIESLQQYKEIVDNETTNYLAEEAKRILEQIEKETKIKLRKRTVQFQLPKPQQQYYGLVIQRPDWDQIDNFIVDCLQIVVNQNSNETKVNTMFQTLKAQLFNHGKQVFEREPKPYISTNKFFDKEYEIDVQIAIIIPDGIVILQPQELGLGLLQDIPVYYHTIDVTKSSKISQICAKTIKKMQKQAVPIETVEQQDVEMFSKTWKAYIVKFKPIKIKLVGKIVE